MLDLGLIFFGWIFCSSEVEFAVVCCVKPTGLMSEQKEILIGHFIELVRKC